MRVHPNHEFCQSEKSHTWSLCLNCSIDIRLSHFLFAGLLILGKYEADLTKLVAERQKLGNAEKLLDLQVTVYPEIISMQKDMAGLRQIYDVYKAQMVRYGYWSLTEKHDRGIVFPANMFFLVFNMFFFLVCLRMQRQSGLRPCGWI